jgi:hypothetical protein
LGILKKSDGKNKSPRKKATVSLEPFGKDSFWTPPFHSFLQKVRGFVDG